MNTTSKNIYQRILAVMDDVRGVKKEADKKCPYPLVSHDAVTGLLHMPFVRHGIVMVPTVLSVTQDGNRTVANVQVTFVNADNPDDKISVTFAGYGIDSQDKGPGKAISYAVKYAMLKTFCLESGDDVERYNADYISDKSETISPEQAYEIRRLVGDDNKLMDRLLVWAGADRVEGIRSKDYSTIIQTLNNYSNGDNNDRV